MVGDFLAGAGLAVTGLGAAVGVAASETAAARMFVRHFARVLLVLSWSQLLWSKCWRVISAPRWVVVVLAGRDSRSTSPSPKGYGWTPWRVVMERGPEVVTGATSPAGHQRRRGTRP